mgnify:CR=1 FL=1
MSKQSQSQLDQAVLDAAAEIDKQLGGTTTTPPTADNAEVELPAEDTESTETESGDEPNEGDNAVVDELTEQELLESKNLYRLLKDPTTARSVVAALAQQTGVLQDLARLGAEPTRTEVRDAKKDILTIFKESLGKEYEFLADRLSKAVDTVITQERQEIQAQHLETQTAVVNQQIVRELETLERETRGVSKTLENRMAELAREIPIGTQDQSTYIRRLYAVAASEKGLSAAPVRQGVTKSKNDRIRSNANDATSRIKGTPADRSRDIIEIPTKKMGLKESVNFALGQLTKK